MSLCRPAACCSTSYAVLTTRTLQSAASAPSLPLRPLWRQRRVAQLTAVRAEAPSGSSASADDEDRVEALEAAVRARKGMGVAKEQTGARRAASSSSSSSGGYAEWKEGELFPEGWEQMDPLEKVSNLYMGKRGFLFWANKLALASCIGLGVAWVVFRIVLPALGVIHLQNDLLTPSSF